MGLEQWPRCGIAAIVGEKSCDFTRLSRATARFPIASRVMAEPPVTSAVLINLQLANRPAFAPPPSPPLPLPQRPRSVSEELSRSAPRRETLNGSPGAVYRWRGGGEGRGRGGRDRIEASADNKTGGPTSLFGNATARDRREMAIRRSTRQTYLRSVPFAFSFRSSDSARFWREAAISTRDRGPSFLPLLVFFFRECKFPRSSSRRIILTRFSYK